MSDDNVIILDGALDNALDNNLNEFGNLFEQFDNIINNLTAFKSQITNIQQQIRNLEKGVKKQMKGLKKNAVKSKNKGNRKPSGFAKPTKVTNDLCVFLNKENGTEIARTEVTRSLVNYIKSNNLENKDNNKVITPDSKLKYLLGIQDGEELTYFNIQKFMNKHFIKNTVVIKNELCENS
jgi:chromatin remodeling complex protein RSC6